MFSSAALLLAFAASFLLVQVSAECTQFSTNGSTAATYDFYRFYDFRNIRDNIDGDAATASSYGKSYTATESANGQSKIIEAAPWNSGWNARDWFRPSPKNDTIDMHYKPSRVSISKLYSLAWLQRSLNQSQATTPTNRKNFRLTSLCIRQGFQTEASWRLSLTLQNTTSHSPPSACPHASMEPVAQSLASSRTTMTHPSRI